MYWLAKLTVLSLVAVWFVNGEPCTQLPPGITRLSRGIDLSTLDLLPLDVTGSLGYKQPVIDFTCARGKKYSQDGNVYDLPDQVAVISSVPGGWLSSAVEIYKDYNEVKRSMSASAGVGLDIDLGSFSSSGTYKKMQHSITNSSEYIEKVTAFDSAKRADLVPYWALDLGHLPLSYVDRRLQARFEDDPEKYNEFIEYYGTHFFKTARYGGVISLVIETKQEYYYGKTEKEVEAQASGSFLKVLKAHGGYSGTTTTVDSHFERLSSKTIKYYGGSTNLLSTEGISTWQPTVSANPWLFAAELEPISELIQDATKKASMERAVTNYLNKALMREYERLLVSASSKMPASFDFIQALLTRVRAAQAAAIPSASEVTSIHNTIQTQIIIPSWFAQKSELCYRWYPDGDGGQCGGGAGRHLCAHPGKKTSWYRDDTDGRGGGCRMGWGMRSAPGYDDWLKNAEICYRWYPDGDGGQCGAGVGRELCAKLGSYTSYYRDDTDGRGGGCRMSWKIKVPSNAPQWALNLQLCYYWYPDGDGGQCGGGAARTLCARANHWTSYYRDDTDGRGGGCRMSWGITTP